MTDEQAIGAVVDECTRIRPRGPRDLVRQAIAIPRRGRGETASTRPGAGMKSMSLDDYARDKARFRPQSFYEIRPSAGHLRHIAHVWRIRSSHRARRCRAGRRGINRPGQFSEHGWRIIT